MGNGKTCVAQNSCNLSYLIRQRQEHQKTLQLKVFTTHIHASQIFLDPIQKRALSRFVQLEAVYLEALLYLMQLFSMYHIFKTNFAPKSVKKLKTIQNKKIPAVIATHFLAH